MLAASQPGIQKVSAWLFHLLYPSAVAVLIQDHMICVYNLSKSVCETSPA